MPENAQPLWLATGASLAGYRSRAYLPRTADVVVIGAGLTGAAAAYHLARYRPGNEDRIVVLDASDPASEASGRNGGQFGLIPQNSLGVYRGLIAERFLCLERAAPGVPAGLLWKSAVRQARDVLRLCAHNRERLRTIVAEERIECDYSPSGWFYIGRSSQEERGIADEVRLARELGQCIDTWTPDRIRTRFGFSVEHRARVSEGDGTYHPVEYVNGLLDRSLQRGVELFTRVRVGRLTTVDADCHLLETSEGTVVARRVIVATNAFTAELLPELAAIAPHQSQIMVTQGAPNKLRGAFVTSDREPVYFSEPRGPDGRRWLLMGGGSDRRVFEPRARRRSLDTHRRLLRARDLYYPELRGRAPSAEWVGTMGFTPDLLPAVGELRAGVVLAAGFCGYGGCYTTAAGEASAIITLTGTAPAWLSRRTFDPERLLRRAGPRYGVRRRSVLAA